MRITVRGWGRNQGEQEIMNVALLDAETGPGPGERYTRDKTYLNVVYPRIRRTTEVHVSTSTKELRLGGRYLLRVELSRKEIAQLFYETHGGDIVRMFRSFVENEEARELAEYFERRRQRLAQKEEQVEG